MRRYAGPPAATWEESRLVQPITQIPFPLIMIALIIAGGAAIGIHFTRFYFLAFAMLPGIFCGLIQPQSLIILAIGMLPYTFSLTSNDPGSYATAAVGISDVLLLLALPGLLAQALRRPKNIALGKLTLPIFLFLAVGLFAFCLNIPKMNSTPLSYFIGFLRTAQIVVVLPLACAVLSWSSEDLRNVLRAYLWGTLSLAVIGIGAFLSGMRGGLYILWMQKNPVGVSLAIGALVAIALLTQPALQTLGEVRQATPPVSLGISRSFLIVVTVCCIIGLICSLSRGSYLGFLVGLLYLAITRKQGRVFALILVGAVAVMLGIMLLLPEDSAVYVKNLSTQSEAGSTRLEQAQLSLEEFKANWLVGDGFRARRDFLPHNLEMTLMAENGLLGSLLFVWVLIAQARLFHKGRLAFLGDPLREGFCVVAVTCSLTILMQSQFDPYWRRGVLWIPWMASGIILVMLNQERDKQRQAVKARARAEHAHSARPLRKATTTATTVPVSSGETP